MLTFRIINNRGKTSFQWLFLYVFERLNIGANEYYTGKALVCKQQIQDLAAE